MNITQTVLSLNYKNIIPHLLQNECPQFNKTSLHFNPHVEQKAFSITLINT